MIRNTFQDLSLPALGLGCMRLPMDEGHNVIMDDLTEMVDYAMENGVNYFDTGYDYHGGKSETVLANALRKYERESYFIADKFPGYDPRSWRRVEAIFEEQLKRCEVEYFDFYLLHNVSESSIDAYLNPRYNIIGYLDKARSSGRIRHLGFSAHGSYDTVKRLLNESGVKFEFAQIQLNYIDYEFQHAREKLALLREYGIPVWVMEPLRGGKLVSPPAPFNERITKLFQDMSYHELAFRFVTSCPEVTLTLSGMSSPKQLRENIEIFKDIRPLSVEERDALLQIAKEITRVGTIPCTACRYCVDRCPLGLDIPRLIEYYNEHSFSGGGFIVPSAVASMKRNERPSACIGCRSCEAFCPQGIAISEVMKTLSIKLGLTK